MQILLKRFFPKMFVEKVQDIDLNGLAAKGIKGLILDIDNTLVASHVKYADENVIKWIKTVQDFGFKACIVSNASKTRVVLFNEKLKLFAIHRASKPGTRAFLKAASHMGLNPPEIAVVGDQIFTDVYGANRAGMYSILTTPIHPEEFFLVKFKRIFEKYILNLYKKTNR